MKDYQIWGTVLSSSQIEQGTGTVASMLNDRSNNSAIVYHQNISIQGRHVLLVDDGIDQVEQ
ncbi:hypothetical protein M3P05_12945 [Sansalvadorimonas sp. 2012CJ34-2]|uniref:Uncharacterized protein n=1 Tax=Parendozoicomonas callyspongiae TaxID=2942213 RepID=A0ABT0PHU8_9GAMM|nr:hypothetical protein [Sansalvadorimonas sp. 2012CJ34-2]MCL6270831.1 hypothetical protein [Sansalvadorimonas sp. 2012CJ34-2]